MLINLLFNSTASEQSFPIQAPEEKLPAEQPTSNNDSIPILPQTQTGIQLQTGNEIVKTLDIALPFWMISPGLQEFAQKFENEHPGTRIHFMTGDENIEFYKNIREWFNDKTIDISLVPSQYFASFSRYAYNMQTRQNIKPFFHNSFNQYFTTWSINYIPFALDPLGILSIESETKTTDFSQVLDLYDQFWSSFAFGYDNPSLILLQQNQEPYPGYFQTLYQLVADRYQSNNVVQLKRFIDKKTDRSLIERRKKSLNQQKIDPLCQKYSHICLLGNKEITAVPWFLSDIVLWDKQFTHTNITSDDVLLNKFPVRSNIVKGRGRVINNQSPELVESVLFVGSYIADAVGGNVRLLPNKMLSALKKTLDIQLTQPMYQNNKGFQNNATMLNGSLDWQNLFMNNTAITQVLQNTYNVELFFTKPEWSF